MKQVIPLILLSLTFSLIGQDAQLIFFSDTSKIDTNFIEDFSDKLVLRSFWKSKTNSLEIANRITTDRLIYRPSPSTSLGIGGNYNWLGLDLALQLPETDNNVEKYGDSKSFDFQVNMYLRKFSVDLSYVRYKGYYLEDAKDANDRDTIIKNKGLRTNNIGGSVNYIFNNKKFSYRAAYLQNERQRKSAGTFFAGGFVSLTRIEAEKGLIPPHYVELYPEVADLTRINSWQIGGEGGYAHTFVVKHFYLTIALGLGLGLENKKFVTKDSRTLISEYGAAPRYQTKAALGYNGAKLSLGLQGVKDGVFIGGAGENEVTYNFGSWRIFMAYRFDAPRPIQFLKKLNPFKKN